MATKNTAPQSRLESGTNKSNKYIKLSEFEDPHYPMLFVIGARGVGKTVHSFAENLARCYKKGTQFIYMRRYQSEIEKETVDTALISQLTGLEIEEKSDTKGHSHTRMLAANGRPICYMLALSDIGSMKTNSFAKVDKVVYDEFIDPKNRELKNETKIFFNFMMTVFRDFSKYRVDMLANATNLFNCYFIDLEIMPKARITKFKKAGIKIVQYKTSKELEKEHTTSKLGKQVAKIQGLKEEALENQFQGDYDDFIRKNTANDVCESMLFLHGQKIGLWNNGQRLLLSDKVLNNVKKKYAMTRPEIRENVPLFPNESLKMLQLKVDNGQIYFSSPQLRSAFYRYFKERQYNE